MNSKLRTKYLRKCLQRLQEDTLTSGADIILLKDFNYISNFNNETYTEKGSKYRIIFCTVFLFILTVSLSYLINSLLLMRCLVSSNYIVWEAARPLSDCSYCINVTKPIILWNVTRAKFQQYAYLSQPIIAKQAIVHWKAMKKFDYDMFKKLYEDTAGSYESMADGCQFLNFKTNLFSLEEVFRMPESRAKNEAGETPWYVGWGNCHPDILAKVREYYSVPDFLPEDAEYPATENIFFGYEIGAVMHLDYIPRLMWQGQVKGNKIWTIAPVLECEDVCNQFQYYVEPGDVVLLDTRLWYHATKIPKGQFSLTVQSEYG